MVIDGVRHALGIAIRMTSADTQNKNIDFAPCDPGLTVSGLSGIEFLLMAVPAIAAGIMGAPANSTVRVQAELISRLDAVVKDPRFHDGLWINRKQAVGSRPAVLVIVSASGAPLARADIELWLNAQFAPLSTVPARGLARGIQKAHGMLGVAVPPHAATFQLVLALPT